MPKYFRQALRIPWKRINIIESLGKALGNEAVSDDKKLFEKADSLGVDHNGIRGKAVVETEISLKNQTGSKFINLTFPALPGHIRQDQYFFCLFCCKGTAITIPASSDQIP